MEKKTKKKKLELICTHCQSPGLPEHGCPYKADVDGDSDTLCICCETCEYECAMDV